jgi:PIN domain nuclease of toxin-antitoxin system
LIWHIFQNKRLSQKAAHIFSDTDAGLAGIFIPSIVLVEIIYLVEKAKIPSESSGNILSLLELSPANYHLAHISVSLIRSMQSISRDLIPDMPDRIIASAAKDLDLPLITRDSKIRESGLVEVIW